MKKYILTLLFFLYLSSNLLITPCMAQPSKIIKHGFYTIEDLNLSPNISYSVQNVSFNERIYLLIFDSDQSLLQGIRLWPQSQKYNLIPLKPGYRIVVTGNGELNIS